MGNTVRVPIKFTSHPPQPLLSGRGNTLKYYKNILSHAGTIYQSLLKYFKKQKLSVGGGNVGLYGHSEYILHPK